MTNQLESSVNQPVASLWTAEHVAAIAQSRIPRQSLIDQAAVRSLHPDLMLWDIWPIQEDDGSVATIAGTSLWVFLSAPRNLDPDDRHDHARMRLFQKTFEGWFDCGNLLPDGFSPGTREWSGSARLNTETNEVTLWFTAAGRREAVVGDFEQRIIHVVGQLDLAGDRPFIGNWTNQQEAIPNDRRFYADLRTNQGVAGRIKGFRDPYWFRDPKDGQGYLLFTGSKALDQSQSRYDGVIGIAAAPGEGGESVFALLPPIVDADGLANELERPHMFVFDGLYYLFWSLQHSVFSPDGPMGPTGLYGMVGSSVMGPFEPLNGTGLVMANPESEPRQAYAWQVLPSLDVVSFIDYWGLAGRETGSDPNLKAAQFGGTIAPMAKLMLSGDTTAVVFGGA